MSDDSRRYRQYAGLALVLIAYVGGIIGWSCAVVQVDAPSSSDADSTQATHRRAAPPVAISAPPPAERVQLAPAKRTVGPRQSSD